LHCILLQSVVIAMQHVNGFSRRRMRGINIAAGRVDALPIDVCDSTVFRERPRITRQ